MDETGWPFAGEKTHYTPYKRNSKRMDAIKLQEQDGTLTDIAPGKAYIRPPGAYYPMNAAKLPPQLPTTYCDLCRSLIDIRLGNAMIIP